MLNGPLWSTAAPYPEAKVTVLEQWRFSWCSSCHAAVQLHPSVVWVQPFLSGLFVLLKPGTDQPLADWQSCIQRFQRQGRAGLWKRQHHHLKGGLQPQRCGPAVPLRTLWSVPGMVSTSTESTCLLGKQYCACEDTMCRYIRSSQKAPPWPHCSQWIANQSWDALLQPFS